MPDKLKGKQILSILQQSPILLWIGTEGHGLYKVNLQTQEITNYVNNPKNPNSISSNYIRSLTLDPQNRLWIGTLNSLSIYDEKHDSFNNHTSNIEISGSLSQTSIRDIFMDAHGGMWLGTYYGGLNYYHPLKNRFHNIQFTAKKNSLNCNTIGCIKEDAQKGIWIGTNNGGLNHYNPHTQQFTHYMREEGLMSNDIKDIYIDEANDLVYIGTHTGGLGILHRKSGQIEIFHNEEVKNIYDIEPAANGELWMTGMSMLVRFNPRNKTFQSINSQIDGQPLAEDQFTYFLRDSKRRLWIGGEKGLSVYTEKDNGLLNTMIIPESSPLNYKSINCIHEARNGIFWIGTRNGIYRFDESKKKPDNIPQHMDCLIMSYMEFWKTHPAIYG